MTAPIIDSHIHLFPASHLRSLAWYTLDSPLGAQHCVNEYRQASSSVPTTPSTGKYLSGFIFLETDRISSIEETGNPGWKHALDEVSLLTRIALGEPIPGEGHTPVDSKLCLGIVPWAPVPGGPDALERYMAQVRERTKTEYVWQKVRGVRYLVQSEPAGVMLESKFVDGLRWLGRQGLSFDLGVDARQGGLHQLREAVEMMERVYAVDEGDQVTIVINHMCKPNLRLPPISVSGHAEFLEWKDLITKMVRASNKTYMKLSGAFSELPPLSADSEPDVSSLVDALKPWTDVVFEAFGPDRVMFGSDWPVCNIGGGGNEVSWRRWTTVVEGILEQRGLIEDEKKGVWGGVAVKAYGITV